MEVPEGFLKRHPFPGPGLAVRVPGDVTLGNRLDILRKVCMIILSCKMNTYIEMYLCSSFHTEHLC